jgi:hypothetical protein
VLVAVVAMVIHVVPAVLEGVAPVVMVETQLKMGPPVQMGTVVAAAAELGVTAREALEALELLSSATQSVLALNLVVRLQTTERITTTHLQAQARLLFKEYRWHILQNSTPTTSL